MTGTGVPGPYGAAGAAPWGAGPGSTGHAPRHPLDPEPIRSSKARAVLALGVVAVLTGPFVGGLVPGTLALLLARQARRQAFEAGGFLTGAVWLRRGEWLAWIGLVLAATTLVVAAVVGLIHLAQTPAGQDFDPNID